MIVQSGEEFRIEQEVVFDGHLYGSTNGEYPFGGQIEIRRGEDGFYFDGDTFTPTPTWLSTVVDSSGLFHYYDFIIPAGSPNGTTFNLRIRITDDPSTETLGTMLVRPQSGGSGGGGGTGGFEVIFDAVDFVAGFPSTVRAT